jgi:isopenicillin-N epimerase
MIGSLAAVPLPPRPPEAPARGAVYPEALQDALADRHRIQVPIVPFPAPPARLVRISAQRYNRRAQYERLASALLEELARERA